MTEHMSSGLPAGPSGCLGWMIAIGIVVVLMTAFVVGVWWAMKDLQG